MQLHRAQKDDIGFIVALEQRPEFSPFINAWPAERHARAMNDPDFRYLMFEEQDRAIGYAFLNGLTSPNRAIQLCRVALAEPGGGRGRAACRLIMEEAFDRLGAHRLYLDLFEDNARAEHLYRALGFVLEGLARDAERRDSEFRSLKLMSILEHEYRAYRPKT
ncbi:MAG TPA: GNAT family protein [Rhizomicrobium sp.]